MGIDLKQFHQAFFEESLELLSSMERALLELNINNPDKDKINLIFRVIHSIKGSSAAFDFSVMSEFTHTIESYLAQVRDGKKIIKQAELDLLLSTVDLLRTMINQLQSNEPNDENLVNEIKTKFINLLGKEQHEEKIPGEEHQFEFEPKIEKKTVPKPEKPVENEKKTIGWNIIFRPHPDIFRNGNDPIFMLRMLNNLGKISNQADVVDIPMLKKINPINCYLGWNIRLDTEASLEEVEKVFNWVIEDCLFDIQPLYVDTKIKEKKTKKTAKKNLKQSVEKPKTISKPTEQPKIISTDIEKKDEKPEVKSDQTGGTTKMFEQTSIRVATNKIDALINNVGELVITQSMLTQLASILEIDQLQKFQEALQQLAKNCHELQSNIMKIRMLPIGFVFDRFHRIVRDIAQKLGKQVELKVSGEQTELDKNMMEKIADPLTHLVRNAIDHGIETPQERIDKNKPPVGLLELSAYQQEGNIVICVEDDGGGVNKEKILKRAIEIGLIDENKKINDKEIYDILFQPGFSTSSIVSDVSGRGVGLDAVRKNIFELGGNIEVSSKENVGTKVTLFLPVTLAIMDCQLVYINNNVFAIPLISITEIIKSEEENIHTSSNGAKVYQLRGNYLPIIYLKDVLVYSSKQSKEKKPKDQLIVVVEINRRLYGVVIDGLLSQQQVVIKSLNENYKNMPGVSGATILGDGSLALIVDINEIIEIAATQVQLYTKEKQQHKITMEDLDIHAREEEDVIVSEEMQVLIFLLGEELYGINILNISEIRRDETITSLPNTPEYLIGIVNVRGSIVPVIDVNKRLNLPSSTEKNAIIIVKTKLETTERLFGIVVDEVCETYQFDKRDITAVADTANIIMRNHFIGLVTFNNKMVTLLRVNNMLPLR